MLDYQQKKIGHAPMPKATELFQLIHTDLGGLYLSTQDSHKYYISFLDNYFGATHIYLLKNKDETFFKFKEYKAAIELQSGKKIKFIHSDGEDEYKNLKFDRALKELSIQWELTAAYTPNQNGKAERLNYTLMSMVHSILVTKKLPKSLWGELIQTAAFLYNRSLWADKSSAFKIINSSSSDLSHLKIVELRTWVYILKEKCKKMNEHFWQGIFVNYESATSNYHIYNPVKSKVQVIHSVNVNENNLFDYSQVSFKEFADEE